MRTSNKITVGSLISPGAEVTIDPFGRNPLAEDCRQVMTLTPKRSAPLMFTGGTQISAVHSERHRPNLLLKLPFTVRHAVAAMVATDEVHAAFELYGDDPYARIPHQGFDEAVGRMRTWAMEVGNDY